MWCDTVTFCHVTVTVWHLWHDTFLYFFLCSKSKRKVNINNDFSCFVKSWHNSLLYPFTMEQKEELIKDLMALKDAVEEEKVCFAPEEDFV